MIWENEFMKKLIPLILLTALVGCTDSSSNQKIAEDMRRKIGVKAEYVEEFNKSFSGDLETDELVLCIGEVFRDVLGCANFVLPDGRFEITSTANTDSTAVIYFTRKVRKSLLPPHQRD